MYNHLHIFEPVSPQKPVIPPADIPLDSVHEDEEQTEFISMPDVPKAPREPILTVISGVCTGLSARVEERPLFLGRDRDCRIILEGSGISRKHARVQQDMNGKVVIDDMGSTNGTFVDGQRITQHLLVGGEHIQIGPDTVVKFELRSALEDNRAVEQAEYGMMDQSTGLHNRRHFLSRLRRDFVQVILERQSISMIKLSVDGYTGIVDQFGYEGGEMILRRIASLIRADLHADDAVARWGEKKISVLLNNTSAKAAERIAENLLTTIRSTHIENKGRKMDFTVSAGVATVGDEDFSEPQDLLNDADDNLTRARQAGGDRRIGPDED